MHLPLFLSFFLLRSNQLTHSQAFDISLLASIASHLAYWADEDVSHFMISQLLARHRVFKAQDASQQAGSKAS